MALSLFPRAFTLEGKCSGLRRGLNASSCVIGQPSEDSPNYQVKVFCSATGNGQSTPVAGRGLLVGGRSPAIKTEGLLDSSALAV